MSGVDWYVEGDSFGNCNCSYGCPCQFEALPTHGNCRGFEVLRIDKGHYGDVRLDGLKAARSTPGPVIFKARARCRSSSTSAPTRHSGKR